MGLAWRFGKLLYTLLCELVNRAMRKRREREVKETGERRKSDKNQMEIE